MASPTIIQQAQTLSGTNVTLTGVTAGNVLLHSASNFGSAASPTVSVSGGGTWAQVPGVYYTNTGFQYSGDFWLCASATGGSTTATATWTAGSNDHNWLLELTAGTVLDTAATSGTWGNTTTAIAVPCSDASSLLVEDTLHIGNITFQSPWTSDGSPNGNPTGHYAPGAAGSYSPTTNSNSGNDAIGWGASFKLPGSSGVGPLYDVDSLPRGAFADGPTMREWLSIGSWF